MGKLLKRWRDLLLTLQMFTYMALCKVIENEENSLRTTQQATAVPETTTKTTTSRTRDHNTTESYHMPGYLIGVILLSILLFFVVAYKLYKHLSTKELRLPCCLNTQPSGLQRRDTTNKPLIRSASGSQGGSIYKKGSQREPEMV